MEWFPHTGDMSTNMLMIVNWFTLDIKSGMKFSLIGMHPLAIKSLVNFITFMSVHKSERARHKKKWCGVSYFHTCVSGDDTWGCFPQQTPIPNAGCWGVVSAQFRVGRLPFILLLLLLLLLLAFILSFTPLPHLCLSLVVLANEWTRVLIPIYSLGTLATHFSGGKAKLGDWSLSVVKATFSWGCGSIMIWKSRRKSHQPSCWNVTKSWAFNICAEYGKKYTHGIGCSGQKAWGKGIPIPSLHRWSYAFVTWLTILCSPSNTLPQL